MKNSLQNGLINHLEDVIEELPKLQDKAKYDDLSDQPESDLQYLLTRQRAVIERICDNHSPYFKQMKESLSSGSNKGTMILQINGVLKALKNDLEKEYLKTFSELLHSEIFVDYLDMAQYLLDEEYKDPAAVITGSSLEIHILQLCKKFGVQIDRSTNKGTQRKTTNQLNEDLAKIPAYTKLDQKSITAWLGLRNKAAHGEYDKYTKIQVLNMLSGVRNFISRNPA